MNNSLCRFDILKIQYVNRNIMLNNMVILETPLKKICTKIFMCKKLKTFQPFHDKNFQYEKNQQGINTSFKKFIRLENSKLV